MFKDPIVEEVRKHRREILESHDWDVEAMMREAMVKQWHRGRKVLSPQKKIIQQGAAPNAYSLRGQA